MQSRTKCPVCKTYNHLSHKDIKAVDVFALYPEMDKSNSLEYCSNLQCPPYFVGQELPAVHTANQDISNVFRGLKERVKAMKHCTCHGCEVHGKIMNRNYRIATPKDMERILNV